MDKEAVPHRTVDRTTQIVELVVHRPGMSFADIVRALGAAKSSVHGFIQGLLAKGWLYEEDHRFYVGPALYGLTLFSGSLRPGQVSHADLAALHKETRLAATLGVKVGDHMIYVDEVGSDQMAGFALRSTVRHPLLRTANGKALLAETPEGERDAYLRRRGQDDPDLVERFLLDYDQIRATRIATNVNRDGTRLGLATVVRNNTGEAVAAVTVVGPFAQVQPRVRALSRMLIRHVDAWAERLVRI